MTYFNTHKLKLKLPYTEKQVLPFDYNFAILVSKYLGQFIGWGTIRIYRIIKYHVMYDCIHLDLQIMTSCTLSFSMPYFTWPLISQYNATFQQGKTFPDKTKTNPLKECHEYHNICERFLENNPTIGKADKADWFLVPWYILFPISLTWVLGNTWADKLENI